MRHRKAGRKLNRSTSHRKAMLTNLVTSLFRHERIQTTDAKAKELRRVAAKLITLGKRGDLHARRLAARRIKDKEILTKLFDDIAVRNQDRNGGYTRIMKMTRRHGDNAPISIIELVERAPATEEEPAASDEDVADEA